MGASGFSIEFERLQGADPSPLEELQPKIWDVLADYTWRYTSGMDTVWDGYLSEAGPGDEDRWFTQGDGEITFWFPDFAGSCGRSAGIAEHWIRAAYAASYQHISSVAQDHGWLPKGKPPKLDKVVWKERTNAWVPIDEDIYEFSFDPDWDDGGVFGDDRHWKFEDMDDEQLQKVRDAVESGLCPCAMCTMLRPDPDFESTMVGSLDDENPDIVSTAIWYLRQTARIEVQTAFEVARRGTKEPRDHAAVCFDFGEKLTGADLGDVLDALQSEEDELTRCGLLGVAAGVQLEDDQQNFQRRLFTFVSALSEDAPIRDVAAEYAGYGRIADGHEDHFARGLVKHIGESDEYDHNVALTLFNFYMGSSAVPQFALDTLEQLAARESEHVQVIAAFAHQQLSTKPTRR